MCRELPEAFFLSFFSYYKKNLPFLLHSSLKKAKQKSKIILPAYSSLLGVCWSFCKSGRFKISNCTILAHRGALLHLLKRKSVHSAQYLADALHQSSSSHRVHIIIIIFIFSHPKLLLAMRNKDKADFWRFPPTSPLTSFFDLPCEVMIFHLFLILFELLNSQLLKNSPAVLKCSGIVLQSQGNICQIYTPASP